MRDELPQTTLDCVNNVVSGAGDRVLQLNQILDKVLPREDDSIGTRGKKALLSISKDSQIEEIGKKLDRYVNLLTLYEITSTDSSRYTSHLDSHDFYDVPLRRVTNFIGREDVISCLDKALSSEFDCKPRIAVLHGMGGQGKTQIALEYCRRSKQEKRFSAIFWANASSETALRKSFERISEHLRKPNQALVDTDSRVALVKNVLTNLPCPWLIVFDNFDDPLWFPGVSKYFPAGKHGHLIFTSRAPDTHRLGQLIEVSDMPEADALNLLLDAVGVEHNEVNLVHGGEITRRLGYLPLAIDQAGAFIRQRRDLLPLDGFLEYYEKQTKTILSATPGVWEYLKQTTEDQRERSKSVFTTWELSFQSLVPTTDAGAKKAAFLSLLGFFSNNDISEEMFNVYHSKMTIDRSKPVWLELFSGSDGQWSSWFFEDVLVQLRSLSLITSISRKGDGFLHVSLHPLVKDWIYLRQNNTEATQGFLLASSMLATCIIVYYANSTVSTEGLRIPIFKRNEYLSHLVAWELNTVKFLNLDRKPLWLGPRCSSVKCVEQCFAYFFHDSDLMANSLSLSYWLWDHCSPGDESEREVKNHAWRLIIENLQRLRQYSKAETQLRAKMGELEVLFGQNDKIVQESNYMLAMILKSQGKPSEAESICRLLQSLSADKEAKYQDGQGHLLELAASLASQDPEDKKVESTRLIETVVSAGSKTATIKYGSSSWHFRQWTIVISYHPDTAIKEKICLELLSTISLELGEDHVFAVTAKSLLANICCQKGDWAAAETLIRECINEFKDSSMRLDIAGFLNILGTTLFWQKRYGEAEKAFRECHNISLGGEGVKRNLWLISLLKEAKAVEMQDRSEEAELLWLEVLKIIKAGKEDENWTVDVLVGLAVAKRGIGSSEKL